MPVTFRPALASDLNALCALEQQSFDVDRLSRRRFQHWIKVANGLLQVAVLDGALVGYGLVLLYKGTRLARLYSLAVDPRCQGQGVAKQLIHILEQQACDRGFLFMRLEVAINNTPAIRLYESLDYKVFDSKEDYYEDHQTALRLQKRIRHRDSHLIQHEEIWYGQNTPFTCGPAALMMAMATLNPNHPQTMVEELNIWRESTTIYMTSGHGGCHPVGLALAAKRRGFKASVYINTREPLFLSGVRDAHKKSVLKLVDKQFKTEAGHENIPVNYLELNQTLLPDIVTRPNTYVLMLISTYRLDGKKAPHWVMITGIDPYCIYVHDPDPEEDQTPLDCKNIPIALDDFDKMTAFGNQRLRTAVVVSLN